MQQMNRIFLSIMLLALFAGNGYSQSGIKIRISGNTGSFLKETGSAEIMHPWSELYSDTTDLMDFTSTSKLGLEAEVIIPLTSKFSFGAEIQNVLLSGYNDNPVWYNFIFSNDNPLYIDKVNHLINYTGQPLMYETSLQNLLGNVRFSPLGDAAVSPYIKGFAGISYIATDFMLKDPEDRVSLNSPALYSIGTQKSDYPKVSAFNYGAALGTNIAISGNFLLYFEGSLGFISSNIVDGMPNYTYNETSTNLSQLDPVTKTAKISRFSFGLCYQFVNGFNILGKSSGSSGSGGASRKSGQTDKYFPFYRRR